MRLLSEELIDAVYNKHRRLIYDNGQNYKPKLSVYIDNELWIKCMSEINGKVGIYVYNFWESNGKKILGYPIYRVIDANIGYKIYEE